MFIVVDGLDELSPEDLRDNFLRYLEWLVRACPSIQLYVATRPLPLIQSLCSGTQAIPVVASREDIFLHVKSRVAADRRMIRKFVMGNELRQDEIAYKVTEKADGVYVISLISIH